MRALRWTMIPLLMAAAPAWAQDKAEKPKKPKMICRSEASTGSRVPTSTCHTAEEWEAIDSANGADANGLVSSINRGANQLGTASGSSGPTGGMR